MRPHPASPVDDAQRTGDPELLALARAGDARAVHALWWRHRDAATSAATAYRPSGDREALASRGFDALMASSAPGPQSDFAVRPQLYLAMRRAAAEGRVQQLPPLDERDAALLASYGGLSPRHRASLWHLDVERLSPVQASLYLGLSETEVSAAALSARVQLAATWLGLSGEAPVTAACEPTRAALAATLAGVTTSPSLADDGEHLRACAQCQGALDTASYSQAGLAPLLITSVFGLDAGRRWAPYAFALDPIPVTEASPRLAAAVAASSHPNGQRERGVHNGGPRLATWVGTPVAAGLLAVAVAVPWSLNGAGTSAPRPLAAGLTPWLVPDGQAGADVVTPGLPDAAPEGPVHGPQTPGTRAPASPAMTPTPAGFTAPLAPALFTPPAIMPEPTAGSDTSPKPDGSPTPQMPAPSGAGPGATSPVATSSVPSAPTGPPATGTPSDPEAPTRTPEPTASTEPPAVVAEPGTPLPAPAPAATALALAAGSPTLTGRADPYALVRAKVIDAQAAPGGTQPQGLGNSYADQANAVGDYALGLDGLRHGSYVVRLSAEVAPQTAAPVAARSPLSRALGMGPRAVSRVANAGGAQDYIDIRITINEANAAPFTAYRNHEHAAGMGEPGYRVEIRQYGAAIASTVVGKHGAWALRLHGVQGTVEAVQISPEGWESTPKSLEDPRGEQPTATPTLEPSESLVPTPTVEPSETPDPTDTAEPTDPTGPTGTPAPTQTGGPSESPEPSETTEPTVEPSESPEPTETKEPSETPEPSESPEPTEPIEPTETTDPTASPTSTEPTRPTHPTKPTHPTHPTKPSNPGNGHGKDDDADGKDKDKDKDRPAVAALAPPTGREPEAPAQPGPAAVAATEPRKPAGEHGDGAPSDVAP